MFIFVVLFIVFLILWLIERRKAKKASATIANADAYAAEKTEESNRFYETKHREALDYYWKKTQSADERAKAIEKEFHKWKSTRKIFKKRLMT